VTALRIYLIHLFSFFFNERVPHGRNATTFVYLPKGQAEENTVKQIEETVFLTAAPLPMAQ
jgi:hypothetical protein